ncbi:hypothetical protein [Cellulomonas sp. NPDC089187]|uniref:hypothetical protein n=1 Tax=Cellulomonas sp. NPDC089187 TaxID=3154970 RepID=UPI003423308B
MSQTMERASARQRTGAAGPSVVGTGLPQINLLPESIRAVRRLRDARGWFGLAVLVCLVLVVLAYLGGTLLVGQAEDDRAAQEQRTAELLVSKGQYAEVTPVIAEVERQQRAILVGSGAEVEWAQYVGAVAAVLPAGMQVNSLAMAPIGLDDGAVMPSDPLVTPGLYQLTFEALAAAAPNAADLIDGLDAVPGFTDARVTVFDRAEDQPLYQVTGTVQVTAAALSGRLTTTEED